MQSCFFPLNFLICDVYFGSFYPLVCSLAHPVDKLHQSYVAREKTPSCLDRLGLSCVHTRVKKLVSFLDVQGKKGK